MKSRTMSHLGHRRKSVNGTKSKRATATPELPHPTSYPFVERILNDCLSPRRYRRIPEEEYNNNNDDPMNTIGYNNNVLTNNYPNSNRSSVFRPRIQSTYHRDFRSQRPDIIPYATSSRSFSHRPSSSFSSSSSPVAPFVLPPPSHRLQEEREQALRDYKVTIEYKHLKSHAPGGVYLIPSMDSLRSFHGIIFIRRGPFTNGIFKFRLTLPPKYNDTNMWPVITFSSRIFNPYVNEMTGELDVKSAYPIWDPSKHYLVTVLTYLKKIFYSKNFADAKANPLAKELAETDPAAYKKKVEECVHESQKNVYVNEEGSTAKFTEEEVAHRVLRDLLKHVIKSENQVTKQNVLAQIEKARKV